MVLVSNLEAGICHRSLMQTIFYLDLIFTKFTAITGIILITLHIVNEC